MRKALDTVFTVSAIVLALTVLSVDGLGQAILTVTITAAALDGGDDHEDHNHAPRTPSIGDDCGHDESCEPGKCRLRRTK